MNIWIICAAAIALAGLLTALGRITISKLVDQRIARYQSDLIEKHCEEVSNMYRQTRGWRRTIIIIISRP